MAIDHIRPLRVGQKNGQLVAPGAASGPKGLGPLGPPTALFGTASANIQDWKLAFTRRRLLGDLTLTSRTFAYEAWNDGWRLALPAYLGCKGDLTF